MDQPECAYRGLPLSPFRLTPLLQNFFRSVRNFVIRTTNMPATTFGTGIHWQVGQATSLINIDFFVSSAAGTKHQGYVWFFIVLAG